MSRPTLSADVPYPCGHPRIVGRHCRECDKLAARRRKADRLARVESAPPIPMRNGRPLVPARIAALIEECRPAYLRAIAPRSAR